MGKSVAQNGLGIPSFDLAKPVILESSLLVHFVHIIAFSKAGNQFSRSIIVMA